MMEGTVTISTTEYNNLREVERGLLKRQIIAFRFDGSFYKYYTTPKHIFALQAEKEIKILQNENSNQRNEILSLREEVLLLKLNTNSKNKRWL